MDHPLPLYTRVRLRMGHRPHSQIREGVVMARHNATDPHEPTTYTVAAWAESHGAPKLVGRCWMAYDVEVVAPPAVVQPRDIGPSEREELLQKLQALQDSLDHAVGHLVITEQVECDLADELRRKNAKVTALAEQVKDLEQRLDTAVMLVEDAYREGWHDLADREGIHTGSNEADAAYVESDARKNLHTEDGAPVPLKGA